MKKFNLLFLIFVICFTTTSDIFAITDKNIFTDPVENIYQGTTEAKPLINNLKFTDTNGHWAQEAIKKAGALDIVKGYDKKYRPNSFVSNQEAIAFATRVSGLEREAQELGERLKNQAQDNKLLSIWSIGYLSLARNNGLITQEQFTQATQPNQDSLPAGSFKRDANATREQAIHWIIKSLNVILPEPLSYESQQNIYNYKDWKDIDSSYINSMEIALANGILKGDKNKMLKPKGALTRAEMAQILSNMDNLYNEAVGLTKKSGTVSGIKDEQINKTGSATLERKIYIRTDNGKVDIIKYTMENNSSPKSLDKDIIVYNSGAVTGLGSLRESSQIEYLVDDINKIGKFVDVKNKNLQTTEVNGKLTNVDFINGTITLKDKNDKTYNYYVAGGLITSDNGNNLLFIDGKKIKEKDLPTGSMFKLKLKNNIVTEINHIGDATLSKELRGLVVENNKEFGYLSIIDNNGKKVTKNYFADQVEVEKQPYYQNGDDIGYLDQMFPNFEYDPRDTTIDKIEIGDIVFITSDKDDPSYIEKISASPNYTMRKGKVLEVNNNIDFIKMLVQFDNGQTNWYEIANGVHTSKSGSPINITNVTAGDYVKLLVNEAILSAGETMESVKEILVEDSGHLIGAILKGKLGSVDPIQKTISLQNSNVLGKSGWEDYQQIRKLSTSNKNISFYNGNTKVSPDFFKSKLKRANGEIYVALENGYSGNVISKITFRNGRDEILEPDVVTNVNVGSFTTSGNGTIKIDEGTIVRKNGKLISGSNINVNDYVRVALNGEGKAGVVDIYDAPNKSNISIARGRVKSVETNKWFTVQSMSILNGDKWDYSPIERKFTIDENTLYITEEGIKNIKEFIGYTDKSVIDKAFTIVFNGDKATHVIDTPFSEKFVSGTIYETGEKIKLKDSKYLTSNKIWDSVSIKDATLSIDTKPNTIVIKNGKVTNSTSLKVGDKLKVLTEKLPEKVTSGAEISGRIIFVEN